ncbi:MAG TPA: putative toxin-antitoxin system toxin component, PIN family [Verrucomicrobiota bacterium]|nr:putative toxin-antitoxin system toxin component, PIN family [Verrucomicrobiota bacterium]HRZ37002.1 putative toxin-antitoxin system toxin component, PIN family [Candidatus Paceibacterota bacterium]HRZ54368.1 putative toxin-antitoxin system toxin component, PIN family [Candidatus Paceibacterota bacterium]
MASIFWQRSTARRALTGLALRRFKTAVSREILEEYETVFSEIRRRLFPQAQPSGALAWITAKSVRVVPLPPPRRLSRDPNDDVCVTSAVAAQAAYLVTQDRDLLALEKPFGVRVVTPVQLIRELRL